MTLFALPLVGRAGLGNMLFPWARAELFARASGARILAPFWTPLRVGPYLRREPEKRNYHGFFRAPHHERGPFALLVRACGVHLRETQIGSIPDRSGQFVRPQIIRFSGVEGYFAPLLGERTFIRDQLWTMTSPSMRTTGADYGGRFIAMHVRRGDLTRQGLTQQRLSSIIHYTPISWFAGMARAIRRQPSLQPVPIVVFTDGSEDEVAELTSMEGVFLHRRKTALADLWTMTHADVLFASGASTFSMWASYLGGMPTIYAPGKLQQRVQEGLAHPFEIELAEGAEIPRLFSTGCRVE